MRGRLFRKYVGLIMGVVSAALIASGGLEIWFSYRESLDYLIRIQREQAQTAATRIGQFVREIEGQLGWTTQLPWSAATLDQRRFDALRLLRQVPAVTELSQFDATGAERLKVSRLAMDVVGSPADMSREPRFAEAVASRVYYGPVYFRRESEPYMTLSVAGNRRDAGVSAAEVNLKFIWDVVSQIQVGRTGFAYVVDAQGRLIAHPDISLVLRNTDMSRLDQVRIVRNDDEAMLADDDLIARDLAGRRVITAHAAIPALNWHVFVEQPLDEALTPLIRSATRTGILLLVGLAIALLAGLYFVRRMVGPIQALQAGAAELGRGHLDRRITVKTGDELEGLANQFNDMAGRLQESYADLERKVEDRTRELSESLKQQTATANVLKVISRSTFELEPVLNALLKTAARLCGADKAVVFRADGATYRVAANYRFSQEFQDLLAALPSNLGRGTLVGRVALDGQTVHIPDCLADPDYTWREGQALGDYRALLGVPLLRSGVPIGVFALARTAADPFTDKQIELVTTFADQAVIAIENVRLVNETKEALAHQTASAEILSVISNSVADTAPVFEKILQSCRVLFSSDELDVLLVDEHGLLNIAAYLGKARDIVAATFPAPVERTPAGQAIRERRVMHWPDLVDGTDVPGVLRKMAKLIGYRSMLFAPMLWNERGIGAIGVARSTGPFKPGELALAQTFADQAVIAIQNARLVNETKEALAHQTASADILRAISSSPTDVQPVFEAIVGTAVKHLGCDIAVVQTVSGDTYSPKAMATPAGLALVPGSQVMPVDPQANFPSRAIASKTMLHVRDWTAVELPPHEQVRHEQLGLNAALYLPLLRGDDCVGVLVLGHKRANAFNDKAIALAESFRDQALIAIENVRLFEEVQARTRDLGEALQQQTATADVLKVISRSTFDLRTVLRTLVESAARLCEADGATITRQRDGKFFRAEAYGFSPEFVEHVRDVPVEPDRGSITGRTLLESRVVHIVDVHSDPDFTFTEALKFDEFRTALGVPMLKEGVAIGALALVRHDKRPFTEKQIELVSTFADQAVIAIENVRLFEQVQDRTRELARSVEELRALGDVSQAVNSTLDIATVLDTIVAKAVQISGVESGAIYVFSEYHQAFRMRASYGTGDDLDRALRRQKLGMDTPLGEAATRREPIQIQRLSAMPAGAVRDLLERGGYQALLIVPLVGADRTIGALVIRRREAGAFPERTVDLLRTFAAQSVLAIQNARLFGEIREKSRQLEVASQHKSQFLANMSHELRTPLNAILGYTELILDAIYGDVPAKVRSVLERVQSNGKHLLGLINDVLDLSKIEAGQLSLTLADYAVPSIVQSVVSATESLARNKGLALRANIATGLPTGHGDERRLTQVLLNLVGNAIKFTERGSVEISAGANGERFRIDVRDTGPGIAAADQQRIFEEFQQVDNSNTRGKGGTGLGLAISRRIVALHGGTISVESAPGAGSTFTIDIPVRLEAAREAA
jgi:GAF domain-containing protein/sensor histidine kinase YesM